MVFNMSIIFKHFIVKLKYKNSVRFLCNGTGYEHLDKLLFPNTPGEDDKTAIFKSNRGRSLKVIKYFMTKPHLNEIRPHIPLEYLTPKHRLKLKHLYLVDPEIAKSVSSKILPYLKNNKEQIICETNAGLGLISSQLLNNGINSIRLYESCYEFRQILRAFNKAYPERVELFVKDIFQLNVMSYIDKLDNGNRVQQLLKGIPKREWTEPVMTIIGPMPNMNFIRYLFRMLALQSEIVAHGRIQIFALMKPMYYLKFTAAPGMSLHVYQTLSILFQLFFECELLEKYPRKSFVPWETDLKIGPHTFEHSRYDLNYIYLVRINFKKQLPVDTKYLLHLYYFINQGFLRGKSKIIPKVEKWLPGIGVNLIVPNKKSNEPNFADLNIYTEFGQLNPTELLQIFLEMLRHPQYSNSPFTALVESELLKKETIESDVAEGAVTSLGQEMQEIFT